MNDALNPTQIKKTYTLFIIETYETYTLLIMEEILDGEVYTQTKAIHIRRQWMIPYAEDNLGFVCVLRWV